MADTTTPQVPPTFKGAILTMNPKIVLAFFLVVVAALLLVFFANILINNKGTIDAGTAAMIATMVTTFILMAKSACDYQTSSSAGSDKKDDAQTAVSKALAEKVPAPASPSPITPAPVAPVAWWGRLTNGEPAAITAAAAADPRIMAFITAANVGAATPDDLAYLVSKNLLTQARADIIKAA